jgi:hypothetical protein
MTTMKKTTIYNDKYIIENLEKYCNQDRRNIAIFPITPETAGYAVVCRTFFFFKLLKKNNIALPTDVEDAFSSIAVEACQTAYGAANLANPWLDARPKYGFVESGWFFGIYLGTPKFYPPSQVSINAILLIYKFVVDKELMTEDGMLLTQTSWKSDGIVR